MSVPLTLPVGESPNYELQEGSDGEEKHFLNEADSLLIYQSLRQSRQAWLSSTFPKFSSRAKGKNQESIQPPPHILKPIGRCDIQAGPHIFSDTQLFEAQYLPEPIQYEAKLGAPPFVQYQASYQHTMSGAQSYASASTPNASGTSAPVLSSLETGDVSPSLITKVNEAAATNPTLQNLLSVAASGVASIDQLKTLGVFIQTLASQKTLNGQDRDHALAHPSGPLLSSSPSAALPQALTKSTDIVLEFRENATERFILPREIEVCKRHCQGPDSTGTFDVILYSFVPFGESTSGNSKNPLVLRLIMASDSLWGSISRWVNPEAKLEHAQQVYKDKLQALPPRVYLQHHLDDSDSLVSEIKSSITPYPSLRNYVPSSTGDPKKPKRKRIRKTVAADNADESVNSVAKKGKLVQFASSAVIPKKRFACLSCGKTDVPQMQGGTYCKICVDSRPATPSANGLTTGSTSTQTVTFTRFIHTNPVANQYAYQK